MHTRIRRRIPPAPPERSSAFRLTPTISDCSMLCVRQRTIADRPGAAKRPTCPNHHQALWGPADGCKFKYHIAGGLPRGHHLGVVKMTSTLIEQSPVLVQAIHEAFSGSDACHCHGDGKLSEEEVLAAMVHLCHVAVADVQREELLPIERVLRGVRFNFQLSCALNEHGLKFLPQFEAWTFNDLLRLNGVGGKTAVAIEAAMAKYGLALKDGDPRRYRHLLQEKPGPECPVIDLPPDQIREYCAKELMSAGQQLLQFGASIFKYGLRASRRERIGLPLKKTVKTGYGIQAVLRSVSEVLHDVEKSEAASRPLTKRGPRVPAEAQQRGNVITGAFPKAADGPDPWAHGQAI